MRTGDKGASRAERGTAVRDRSRLLAAVAAALLLVVLFPGQAWAPFTGGPSVRVTPNSNVEIRWTANFVGEGQVEIFDNPNGGTPINGSTSANSSGHTIEFSVGGVLHADTAYYFRVTHTDPGNAFPELNNDPAPYPPFFTGAQGIGNVTVAPGTDSAVLSWDANVIGLGRVEILSPGGLGPFDDANNTTDHSIELTGLQPATTYEFRVSNRHAIDGDALAAKTGSFTTLSTLSAQFLEPLTQSTDPAHPVINTGKNGKVIPVRAQISQGGVPITDLNAPGPVTIAVSKLACGDSAGSDPVTSFADAGQSSAGTNQFGYDATVQAWVYNLDTRALGLVTGNCYRIDVSVNGTQITNAFVVFQPTR